MVTPATVDLQRCAILESMVKWFEDKKKVADAMTRGNPKLMINVDETQLQLRKKTALRKVLWLFKGSKNGARVTASERIDSHLTLFVGVSAAGDVMKPAVLISKYVNGFNSFARRRHSLLSCTQRLHEERYFLHCHERSLRQVR